MASRNLGTLTLDLVAKIGGFEKGMDQAARIADKRLREIQRNAKLVGAAIGAALVAGAGIVAKGVRDIIDEADKLNDLNQRLGLSAEALSGYAYAAKQSGTDIDSLARGMKLLAKNTAEAVDAGSEQGKLFSALGIDVIDQATGKLRSLEDLLPEIADKFKALDDATLESAIAQKLFGKSGDELIEFLNLGRQGIADYRDELRAMGGEMNGETLRAADELKDTIAKIQTQFDGIYLQLAQQLLPTLQDFADYLSESAKNGSGFTSVLDGLGPVLRTVGDYLGKIGDLARLVGLNFGFLYESIATAAAGIEDIAHGDLKSALQQMLRLRDLASNYKSQFGDLVFGDGAPESAGAKKKLSGSGMLEGAGFGRFGGAGLHGRLKGLLDGEEKAGKKSAASEALLQAKELEQAMRAQADAAAEFRQQAEDLAATLGGPLAQAELEAVRREDQLVDLARRGQISQEDLAKALDLVEIQRQKAIAAYKAQLTPAQEVLAALQEEMKLLGMTAEQQEVYNALKRAGVTAESEYGQQIRDTMAQIQAAKEAQAEQDAALREQIGHMDELRDSFQDNVADVLAGTKSIGDAFKSMGDLITQQIARIMAQRFTDWLFGGSGSSGGGGLGGLIGMFFGGSSSSSGFGITSSGAGGITGTVPGFAGGTSFAPGGLSLVGEEGPELVNLPRGAQVMPAETTARMLGGPQIVQHITVEKGASQETVEQAQRKLGRATQHALARTG